MSPYLTTDWDVVVGYSGTSLQYTLTDAVDGIVTNEIYRFRIRSQNDYGNSEWSPTIAVAVAALPSAPLSPTKVQALSTQKSIFVTWQKPLDTQPITGYQLFIIDYLNGKTTMIYDGERNPNILRFNAEKLVVG